MIKIEPDLKNTIIAISQKEKDKLLLRLCAKDDLLIEQLHYKLLEDEADLTHRCESLMQFINDKVSTL